MNEFVTPQRKKAKPFRWLIVLLLLGVGGYFIYSRYFRNELQVQPVVIKEFSQEREIAGHPFKVTLYAVSREQAEEAFRAAFQKGEEIRSLTADSASGELAELNAAPAGRWHPLPHELYTIVAQGLELAEVTGGAYDPALGALRQQWQAALAEKNIPISQNLDSSQASSGWQNLALDPTSHAVRRNNAVVQVDISDIAIGACLDQMMASLLNAGVQSALIVSGSEVRASDSPPNQMGWTVVVQQPGKEAPETLTVSQCGISTTKTSTATLQIDERQVRTEINPRTLAAVTEEVQATVVAPNCLTAQALAEAAKFSPSLIAGFSPSTDIHSRISTPSQYYLSKGFPPITAINSPSEGSEEKTSDPSQP
jgi:thiamine biosynthesis lipoprotein